LSYLSGSEYTSCHSKLFILGNIDVARGADFFTLLIGFVIGWFLHSYLAYRKDKKEFQNINY